MTDTTAGSTRYERTRDCLAIVLCATVVVLLLRPFQNTPFLDDFLYGWSVEWFLKHHELRILELSTCINVFQILWGALFCLPFGFSFSALRVSTWVLSVAALCGLYLTLRELGVGRRDALIGTAVLAFYPVYFILSFTFMTDAPFLSAVIWFSYAFLRAIRAHSDRWLVAATIFACIACGIRLLAVALPIVMLIGLLLHEREWGRRKARFLLPLVPLLFFCFLLLWLPSHTQVTADVAWVMNSPANRVKDMKLYALPTLHHMLLFNTTFVFAALGVGLLALTAGCLTRRHLRGIGVGLLILGVAFAVETARKNGMVIPLKQGSLWSFRELGITADTVSGHRDENWADWWTWTWQLLTLTLGSATFALLARRKQKRGEESFYWLGLGQFLLIAILWLFYDRTVLPLVPLTIVLIISGNPILRPRLTAAVVGVFAVFCLVGMRDHLELNGALWNSVAYLQKNGATDAEISGAYPVDGWLQYAHPEYAPRDSAGKISVPWVTSKTRLRYEISTQPARRWKLRRTVPYRMWLNGPGFVYISERPPGLVDDDMDQ